MFGEYAALAKWVLIIATVSAVVYAIDDNGYDRAWNKHKDLEKTRMEAVTKIIHDEHDKFIKETERSSAYADFIAENYNDKIDKIKQLSGDIIGLNSDVSRMRQRTLCGRGSDRVHKAQDTGVHVDNAGVDDGFSDEFIRFLESEEKRQQLERAWSKATVDRLKQLCTEPNIECEQQKP